MGNLMNWEEYADLNRADDYDPPRPADEPCEDSPVEGGKHVVDRAVSDDCVNCKREVES